MLLAPLFAILWNALAKRGLEPPIPIKFGLALVGVGAGFLFLVWGAQFAGADFKVGIWWLAGLYLIHSIAELMHFARRAQHDHQIVDRAHRRADDGRVVPVDFGRAICRRAWSRRSPAVETVGGQVTNLQVSLETYLGVFTTIGWISVGIGVVLLLLSWPLKYLMHGVK